MPNSVNKPYFMDLIRHRQMSLRQLAKKIDILPSQLSLTLSSKRRMQLDEAVQIAEHLGVPLEQVVTNAGIEASLPQGKRCSVVGVLGGDGTVETARIADRITMPDALPKGTVAVQARTADSSLGWMDGWLFFAHDKQSPDELIGRFCWVKIEDGPQVLASIGRGYEVGTYNLSGPVTMVSQRLEWAMPILLTRQP